MAGIDRKERRQQIKACLAVARQEERRSDRGAIAPSQDAVGVNVQWLLRLLGDAPGAQNRQMFPQSSANPPIDRLGSTSGASQFHGICAGAQEEAQRQIPGKEYFKIFFIVLSTVGC